MRYIIILFITAVVSLTATAVTQADTQLGSAPEAEEKLKQAIWMSVFKEAVYSHPEQFSRYLTRRNYGQDAADYETIRTYIDKAMKFSKHIPALRQASDFAKDVLDEFRNSSVGSEGKKKALMTVSNRCPNCLEREAYYAYQLMKKHAGGKALSAYEKAAVDVLSEMVDRGQLLSPQKSAIQLLPRANPNYVTLFINTEVRDQIGDMITEFYDSNREQYSSIMGYLAANLKNGELKSLALDLNWFKKREQERDLQQASKAKWEELQLERERWLVSAEANIRLAGAVLNITNPQDSARFVKVGTTALSIQKAYWDWVSPVNRITTWAFTATTVAGVLEIANLMQDQSRSSETEYVMNALIGIQQQLEEMKLQVKVLDVRLQIVQNSIDQFARTASAQFDTLRKSLKDLEKEVTNQTLVSFQDSREKVLSADEDSISGIANRCKTYIETLAADKPWSYKSATDEQRTHYTTQCLTRILQKGIESSRTSAVTSLPQTRLETDSDIDLLERAIASGIPLDVWIPQIKQNLPINAQTTSESSSASNSSAKKQALCSELVDVQIWSEAVRVYTELRAMAPDFVLSPTGHSTLWDQDQKIRSLGNQERLCLKDHLTLKKLSDAVQLYRDTARGVFMTMDNLTLEFLNEQWRKWCVNLADDNDIHQLDHAKWQEGWISRNCNVSTGEANAIRDEGLWYAGSTRIPSVRVAPIVPTDLLLLHQDIQVTATHFAKNEPPAPAGIGSSPTIPLSFSPNGKLSDDLKELVHGLRGIVSLRTVLGEMLSPKTVISSPTITVPNIDDPGKVRSCLDNEIRRNTALAFSGDNPRIILTKCGEAAVSGCFSFSETNSFSIFKYDRVCTGAPYIPTHHLPLRLSANYLHDDMVGFRSQSLSRHMSAAIAFRNHGEPQPLSKDQCGNPMNQCNGTYSYSIALNGLSAAGVFGKDKSYIASYELRSVPANIQETFTLDQMESALNPIQQRYKQLVIEWLKFLKDHKGDLDISYKALNYAYSQLLVRTALHLQLVTPSSEPVSAFILAPLSGKEISDAVQSEIPHLPEKFMSRLLLSDDNWRGPFPTVSRAKLVSESLASDPKCVKPGITEEGIILNSINPKRLRPREMDLYCQMWRGIVAAEQRRTKEAGFKPGNEVWFPVGSGFLDMGLELLARQQKYELMETALSQASKQKKRSKRSAQEMGNAKDLSLAN